jgi:hypothetical protein
LRTEQLAATQRGNAIILRWPKPNMDAMTSLGFDLQRIDVYRLIEAPGAPATLSEDEFATRAVMIGSVNHQQISVTPVGGDLMFTDGPVTAARRLRYAVRYVSARGQSAALSNIAVVEPNLKVAMPPGQVQVRDQAQNVVAITWTAPEQNVDGSIPAVVLGYNVYRRTGEPGRFDVPLNGATPVTATQFLDRQFDYGTEYVYSLRALSRGAGGEVIESSDSESAAHRPQDTFAPAAPEGLTAGSAMGVISLFWATSTEPDVAGYNIYRAEATNTSELKWVKLNQPPHALNTFRDEQAVRGKTYFYKVTAVDRAGNESGPSAIVSQEVL